MKYLALLFFFTLLFQASIAQTNEVGMKAGVIGVDGAGEFGYNLEINYGYSLERFPRWSIGFDLGFAKQNDFPDYFDKSFVFAENNGVTAKIDQHIKSQRYQDSNGFAFSSYNVNYLRFLLKFRTVSFKGLDLNVFTGILIRDENSADFSLYHYSLDNEGFVDSYRSNYRLSDNIVFGWPLGVELKKEITSKLSLSLDALYGIPFNRSVDRPVNFYSRLGVSRTF